MISKPDQHPIFDDYLLKFSDRTLHGGELSAFLEFLDSDADVKEIAMANRRMRNALKSLPAVKARKGFGQRMAARFALELEQEAIRENRARLNQMGEWEMRVS